MTKPLYLFLLLFCFSQVGISQVDLNIDKTISIEEDVDENYTPYIYISNGIYKIKATSDSSYSLSLIKRDKVKELNGFIQRNKYSLELITNETSTNWGDVSLRDTPDTDPYVWTYIFRLKDSLGNPLITKKEATKQILKLKEFLDKEIITQNEFDDKAKGLKAIILN